MTISIVGSSVSGTDASIASGWDTDTDEESFTLDSYISDSVEKVTTELKDSKMIPVVIGDYYVMEDALDFCSIDIKLNNYKDDYIISGLRTVDLVINDGNIDLEIKSKKDANL